MAELLLDRLALQELHIVDQQHVDAAQLLLEGERCLGLQGANEAIHEFLGGQINDALARLGRRMADGLQKMGLSQAHGRMDIERIIDGRLAWRGGGDPLGRRMGELVRLADEKTREGQAAIKRRARQAIRIGRELLTLRAQDVSGHARGLIKTLRGTLRHEAGRSAANGRRKLGIAALGHADARRCLAGGGPHIHEDGADRRRLGAQRGENLVGVMRLDPALQKACRHGEQGDAIANRVKLQPPEP